MNIKYNIEFFNEWHCGSGLSAGADVDSLVIKDKNNLPYIPGKTIKGLVREAMTEILNCTDTWEIHRENYIKLFGNSDDKNYLKDDAGKTESIMQRSESFFANAELNSTEKEYLISKPSLIEHLYRSVTNISIDKKGITNQGSLHRIETTIPLTLEATIMNIPDDERFKQLLIDSLKFIKRLGLNRNRGLGRCQFNNITEGGNK